MELINKALLVGKDGLFAKRGCPGNCQYCSLWSKEGCRVILEAPTVDAVEVVHGHWIEEYVYAADPHDRLRYKCSVCGRTEEDKEPYCNCGAKMDGGNNEND